MKERIFDILVWLMSEMQHKTVNEIDLADLKDRGYTQSEINAAFTWIEENVMPFETFRSTRSARPGAGSRRVFHAAEKLLLTTESQGYLIQLSELGLIDDRDFEMVLERAMSSGFEKISVDDLREVVATVLLSKEGRAGGAPPSALKGGDTIH